MILSEDQQLEQATKLGSGTGMDAVTLRVGDLENMSSYYTQALALEPMAEKVANNATSEVHRVLGRGGVPFIRLIATPDLPPVDRRQPGLYHTAWLFPDRAGLAATVYHAARDPRSRYVGASDHLISEAFYFTDPEGNGIELYIDRDRSEWIYRNGEVAMDTIGIDPNAFLSEHLTEDAVDHAGRLPGMVGHVHLQVGDIGRAREFYVDALGFEATLTGLRGALFASAGGYHHHVAMNTWHSRGAGPRAATLGLGNVAVSVSGRNELDALGTRLRDRGLQFRDHGNTISVDDPWGTVVDLSVTGADASELLAR